ncbi:endonuclease [Zunongwangia sp. H14]|uniref:endonuclease n=1 Tax=Zunongwangia sp. H14 TaxID=3240792 RepID=UPI003566A942
MILKTRILIFFSLFILAACSSDDDNTITDTPDTGETGDTGDEEQGEDPGFIIPDDLATYYADVDFSLSSEDLEQELSDLTIARHTTFLSYTDRHDYLYNANEDPDNDANVVLVYSGESRDKREYVSSANSYSPQTFNTEHIYPQSYLSSDDVKADLHNLEPGDQNINSSRENYPFADGEGSYHLVDNASWYPGEDWTGDIARIVMYMNLTYGESFSDVGGMDLFLKWNAEDPVSVLEANRNDVIESAQGNRNPFIDNPYLATLIWGGDDAVNTWTEDYTGPVSEEYTEDTTDEDNEDEDETPDEGEGDEDGEGTTGNNENAVLLFSEYVEGSGNNKALEIVNLSEEAIDLEAAGYSIMKQSNGSGDWSNALPLTGTLEAGDVLVVINSQSDLQKLLDEADIQQNGAPIDFNGNDAVGLFKNDELVDIIGVFNNDADYAKDITLRRKAEITEPATTYDADQWEILDRNDVDGIGTY